MRQLPPKLSGTVQLALDYETTRTPRQAQNRLILFRAMNCSLAKPKRSLHTSFESTQAYYLPPPSRMIYRTWYLVTLNDDLCLHNIYAVWLQARGLRRRGHRGSRRCPSSAITSRYLQYAQCMDCDKKLRADLWYAPNPLLFRTPHVIASNKSCVGT